MGKESIYEAIGEKGKSLLDEEVTIINDLRHLVSYIPEDEDEYAEPLDDILEHIEELFLLVIIGEVKAGKSSFVNTLFGQKICKEGVTPVTDQIHILRYGEEEHIQEIENFIMEHRYPFEPLKNINVVDTPGTNSLVLEHQQITERFVPRSDLVLFITSIDRPFTESERQLLEFIKESWGKKIIFVLSKIDIKQEDEVEEVMSFIKENCNKLLDFDPLLFPVSSKLAFESKQNNDEASWEKSRFGDLENYIFQVLSETERLKLKLSGPIFTALKLAEKLLKEVEKRKQIIEMDLEVVVEMDKILSYEEKILKKNYKSEIDKITLILRDLERWGRDFFDQNLQLSNIKLLLKKKERKVIISKDALLPIPKMIEQNMEGALDRLFKGTRSVWDQIYTIMEGKFKTDVCVSEYKEDEKKKINDIDSTSLKREMKEIVAYQMHRVDVEDECKNILMKTYKFVLILGGGTAFLLFLGLLMNLFGNSGFLNFIGIILILSSIGAMAYFIPKQKNIAVQNFLEKITKLGDELKWQMDRFYEREHALVMAPLKNAVNKREELLVSEQVGNQQEKSDLDKIKERAKAFQKKLDNLGKEESKEEEVQEEDEKEVAAEEQEDQE